MNDVKGELKETLRTSTCFRNLEEEALHGIAGVTFENLAQYRAGKRSGELANAVVPPK